MSIADDRDPGDTDEDRVIGRPTRKATAVWSPRSDRPKPSPRAAAAPRSSTAPGSKRSSIKNATQPTGSPWARPGSHRWMSWNDGSSPVSRSWPDRPRGRRRCRPQRMRRRTARPWACGPMRGFVCRPEPHLRCAPMLRGSCTPRPERPEGRSSTVDAQRGRRSCGTGVCRWSSPPVAVEADDRASRRAARVGRGARRHHATRLPVSQRDQDGVAAEEIRKPRGETGSAFPGPPKAIRSIRSS